ncbi:hypothetical protein BDZ91DRAFT_799090 [Kalaharituber pfeilii]|nr:hypothetical protein BDZ91DRAFT_799090 [Kalaharituber pfeilii]
MSVSYTSILQFAGPVLSCESDSAFRSPLFRNIHTTIWIDPDVNILSVDSSQSISMDIHMFFDDAIDVPLENSLVEVHGALIIRIINEYPQLTLRGLSLSQYPGDPDSEHYIEECPDPRPATLNVIGQVEGFQNRLEI